MAVNTKQAKAPYDHPNFLVVRERHLQHPTGTVGTQISAPAANSAYVGSTLRCYTKALVVGATVIVGSGGSAAATNSIDVSRNDSSLMQTFTFATSAGASALNDIHQLSLTTGFTLNSVGDFACLLGGAASADKMVVLKDVMWRYKLLPADLDCI